MSKILVIFAIGLWLALALQCFAGEPNKLSETDASHYSAQANSWVEGTLTKADSNGSFVVRGAESPYARDYNSFQREYHSYPPTRREEHSQELMNSYGDRLRYSWNTSSQKDYPLMGGTEGSVGIFEEPDYGRDPGTWSIRAEPRAFPFGDLREGDRVAVGFDSFDRNVYTILLINPGRGDSLYIGPDK